MAKISSKAGFVDWEARDHKTGEITDIVVNSSERGKGHGSKLLERAEKAMSKAGIRYVYVFTELTNINSQRFYAYKGFDRVGELPGLYAGSRHGVIFGKVI